MRRNRRYVLRGTAALVSTAGFTTLAARPAADHERVIAKAAQGRIEGLRSGGLVSFKGIAYGGSVKGPHRFLPAPPPTAWTGVRSALAYGAPSLQHNTDYPAWIDPKSGAEDCLYLNVWTPSTSGKRAVMV